MKIMVCAQCREKLHPWEHVHCYVCKKARIRNNPSTTAAELNTTLSPERRIKLG